MCIYSLIWFLDMWMLRFVLSCRLKACFWFSGMTWQEEKSYQKLQRNVKSEPKPRIWFRRLHQFAPVGDVCTKKIVIIMIIF